MIFRGRGCISGAFRLAGSPINSVHDGVAANTADQALSLHLDQLLKGSS
jgi:hypothetical protein